ncbi:hypothetical protein [Frankia sp. AgKG'84/4]
MTAPAPHSTRCAASPGAGGWLARLAGARPLARRHARRLAVARLLSRPGTRVDARRVDADGPYARVDDRLSRRGRQIGMVEVLVPAPVTGPAGDDEDDVAGA